MARTFTLSCVVEENGAINLIEENCHGWRWESLAHFRAFAERIPIKPGDLDIQTVVRQILSADPTASCLATIKAQSFLV